MYTTTLLLAFSLATQTLNLPKGLLSAMCYVESTHQVKAYAPHDGTSPSIGVCQVKLATARMYGFTGTEAQLAQPQLNVYYAGRYLQAQLKRYQHDIHKAVCAYNSGTFRPNPKGEAKNVVYAHRVMHAWSQGH